MIPRDTILRPGMRVVLDSLGNFGTDASGVNWAGENHSALSLGAVYTITCVNDDSSRIRIEPPGHIDYWHTTERFRLLDETDITTPTLDLQPFIPLTNEDCVVGHDIVLRTIPEGSWIFSESLTVGNTYRITDVERNSSISYRIRVSPPGPHNYWVEIAGFSLLNRSVDDLGDIVYVDESLSYEFKDGDKVYVRHLNDMPDKECENWAKRCSLKENVEYTIRIDSHPNQEVDGCPRCKWVKVLNTEWLHHPSRFILASYRQLLDNKGQTDMPQVISNCEIGTAEKAIFQSLANAHKKDVYVYDIKFKHCVHPEELYGKGIHIYCGCSLDRSKPDPYERIVNSHGSEFRLMSGQGDIYFSDHNAVFLTPDVLNHSDNCLDIDRILYLYDIIKASIGPSYLKFEISDNAFDIIKYKSIKQVESLINNNKRDKDLILSEIRDLETRLTIKHRNLSNLSKISFTYIEEDSGLIFEQIKQIPNIESVSVVIERSDYITLVIKTLPLIVHLPHGDLPVGSITISLRWENNLQCTIKGEYGDMFHPHYEYSACWGGYDSMIQKLLVNTDIPALIVVIMQWHGAYDGSGVYRPWNQVLNQQCIGITINEGLYLSGDNEDNEEDEEDE